MLKEIRKFYLRRTMYLCFYILQHHSICTYVSKSILNNKISDQHPTLFGQQILDSSSWTKKNTCCISTIDSNARSIGLAGGGGLQLCLCSPQKVHHNIALLSRVIILYMIHILCGSVEANQQQSSCQRTSCYKYKVYPHLHLNYNCKVNIIQNGSTKEVSHACGEDAKSICSGCRIVHFCSKECQVLAWPSHKAHCKASKKEAKQHLADMWDAAHD